MEKSFFVGKFTISMLNANKWSNWIFYDYSGIFYDYFPIIQQLTKLIGVFTIT